MATVIEKPAHPPGAPDKTPAESIKETIDSIIIALSLALVFRAFIIEAFVIPTGSMADTLLGQHRHFVCPDCGYPFDVGVEVGRGTHDTDIQFRQHALFSPNCAWEFVEDAQLSGARNPDRGGDKILVFKFPYLFAEPDRWDVVVFYNPAKPDDNFIKRLVGKPGEFVQIIDGDVYVGTTRDDLRVQRKPPHVQAGLWRPVFLNDYQPRFRDRAEIGGGIPGWLPDPAQASSGWSSPDGRRFQFSPTASPGTPDRLLFQPPSGAVRGRELRLGFYDYFAYNQYPENPALLNVVQDLRLEFVVFFKRAGGAVSASLNRDDHRFTAVFRQDGQVELLWTSDRGGREPHREQTRVEPFPLDRGVAVAIQNVDFHAGAWVDGRQRVAIGAEQGYRPGPAELDRLRRRTAEPDGPQAAAAPPRVWIETHERELEVRHLGLLRDVYYTARISDRVGQPRTVDRGVPGSAEEIVELRRYPDHPEDDEFFVLGDNSPSSSDGRVWSAGDNSVSWHLAERYAAGRYRAGRVPRDHLIGRAFFVYWPAGLPVFGSSVRAIPSVGRMRWIH